MHDALKKALGVNESNCSSCKWLGDGSDGFEYSNHPWPICENPKKKGIDNLKSFPFKRDMACWEPNFWHTNLPKKIKDFENHEDINAQYAIFHSILKEHQPCWK